jgi:translation initiation factor 1A
MPKNKKGGKKFKRGKKSRMDDDKKIQCADQTEGQMYALVTKALGDRRFDVLCMDGKNRMCHVAGRMKKRSFVRVNDVVLISVRDFEPAKGDIILKYDVSQASRLDNEGELTLYDGTKSLISGVTLANDDEEDDAIIFEDI